MSLYLGTTPIANTGYDKANTDLSNLTNTGKNIANWSNNVTNCITEIPQDIKLELNNGTLTLKAGSKVYVPNGFEADGVTPKFDVVVVASDVTTTPTHTNTEPGLLFYRNTIQLNFEQADQSFSGTTAPSGFTYMNWYDTANNLVKRTDDGGATWITGYSLPIGIYHNENKAPKSIDQVFNGFGYIGSTVFALPGVKGLIPNGRNADGTLKNIETSVSNVRLLTLSSSVTLKGNGRFLLNASGGIFARVGSYDENNNYVLGGNGVEKIYGCVFADNCTVTSGVINILNPKTAFHALDYNDSSTISGWSMPSSRYINLTLGASGTTYTAPANGWIYLSKDGAANTQIRLANLTSKVQIRTCTSFVTALACFIPVKRGDVVNVIYNAAGNTNEFRFVYAEGEN